MARNKENDIRLKSGISSVIEELMVRVTRGEHQLCPQILERLNELHQEICIASSFSVFAMLRYTRHRSEFTRLSKGRFAGRVPDFFSDDYLELRFASDPSDFGVVLALAVKSWESGRTIRARQLLGRVASSRFKEHKFAAYYMAKYFEAPDQPVLEIAAASKTAT